MADYTPLPWLSFALDYSVWRLNPVGYHLTNLILHALNAVLFYRVAEILIRSIFPQAESREALIGAAVAAMAFAVHPLRVESVAWASERRDVLSGFFYLATILFYLRSKRALSIACFACAALSKATIVPLPAALLALDYYPLRRIGAGETPAATRARITEKLPYILISAAAGAMAVRAQLVSGNFTAIAAHGLLDRLAQTLYATGFYVWKTVFPTGLSALYPIPEHGGLLVLPAAIGAAKIAAVAALCAALGVPRKARSSLWVYYLALLLPVCGLLQNGPQLVALRYSYLSCMGWSLAAGCAALYAVRRFSENAARSAAILGVLVLWLSANAWAVQRQIALWRDDRTLWENVLSRYPLSAYANMNMADGLLQERQPQAAEAYARIAVRLAPDNRAATLALAEALSAQNRLPEARDLLDRRLAADPNWGNAQALLGVVLNREGRGEEALGPLLRAAALLPSSAEAQDNAGSILALRGRFAEAIPYFEKAARIDPENPSYPAQANHARRDLAEGTRK